MRYHSNRIRKVRVSAMNFRRQAIGYLMDCSPAGLVYLLDWLSCWIGCVSHPARPLALKMSTFRALQARRLQSSKAVGLVVGTAESEFSALRQQVQRSQTAGSALSDGRFGALRQQVRRSQTAGSAASVYC